MRSSSFMTKIAFTWMHLAEEPLTALYTLLLFILRKDAEGTTLQISLFAAIRPVVSVLSFYWSANLSRKRGKLLSNLMGAWILARLPFLLLPWIDNAWLLIAAAAIYQLFSRASMPAMMEILKIQIERPEREGLFVRNFVFSFIESMAFGLFIGKWLDIDPSIWKTLFTIASLLSMSSIFFQMQIPLPKEVRADPSLPPITANRILQPIKDCIHLMRTRPDFAHFQWGFMIGGLSLTFITPALQVYYVDVLHLTHDALSIARYIWMGIGVITSSFAWKKALEKLAVHRLTGYVLCGFSLFSLTLLFATHHIAWLNIAFLLYGIAQGGSHLLWHLSGTLFAKNEDSSKFSGINILMVGIRGLIGPILGGIACTFIGPVPVLICGIAISLFGISFLFLKQPGPYLQTDEKNAYGRF